jgi:exonuclease III
MNTQGSPTENAAVGRSPEGTRVREGVRGEENVVVPREGVRREDSAVVAQEAGRKKEGIIRIGFNNINGIRKGRNDSRNRELQSFIAANQFDVIGMAETNIHWKNSKASPKDIMYGWFQRLHISFSYFQQYPCEAQFQVGGVLQMASGDITTKISHHGGDEKGLGRWTWHTFNGKQRKLRVITAYRPVKNYSNAGSVWNQQQYYLDKHNIDKTPHEQWIDDLSEDIGRWIREGDSIVLMADFNDDVHKGPTVRTLKQLGLVDILESIEMAKIPTFQRGSVPIDTIMTTREISIVNGGYIRSPSDHLCIWFDVNKQVLFDKLVSQTPVAARRLQCSDPRTVHKYNTVLWEEIRKRQLVELYERLEVCTPHDTTKQAKLWEKLDTELVKLRLCAEKKCRKLKMGCIQWTPELANMRIVLKYWCLVKKICCGNTVD